MELEELLEEQFDLYKKGLITLDELTKFVIASSDGEAILALVNRIPGVNIKLLENEIEKYPRHIIRFTRVKGADIKRLESMALNSNDPWVVYNFARFVAGANIGLLEDKIIEIGDPNYINKFMQDVIGADREKLKYALKLSGNLAAMGECAFYEDLLSFAEMLDSKEKPLDLVGPIYQEAYNRGIDTHFNVSDIVSETDTTSKVKKTIKK